LASGQLVTLVSRPWVESDALCFLLRAEAMPNLKWEIGSKVMTTNHVSEKQLYAFLTENGPEFSPEEVEHLAHCDECSRLLAAVFKLYRDVA
jgi:hypothetical protein